MSVATPKLASTQQTIPEEEAAARAPGAAVGGGSKLSLFALFAVALFGAWLMFDRFSEYVFEDSYITFRYADNLARGNGFCFTPGERLLGTTTPLYTLVLALLGSLGADIPVAASALFSLSVAAIAVLGGLILRSQGFPFLALLFAVFAAAGGPEVQYYWAMETPFVTALLLGALLSGLHRRARLASVLLAAAFVARYDTALFTIVYFAVVTLRDGRVPWASGLLATALVLPWLIFAQLYFGSIFPNTLGAKTGATGTLEYLVTASELQIPRLLAFIENIGLPSRLGDAAGHALVGTTAVGVTAALVWIVPRRSLLWVLVIYPPLLLLAYALIGPPLAMRWYLVPAVFCFGLLAFLGLGAIGRRIGLARVGAVAALVVAAAGVFVLPRHFDACRFEYLSRLQYRYRVVGYQRMSEWILRSGLTEETLLTGEPGYITYITKNPVIDSAGLVSKISDEWRAPSGRPAQARIARLRKPGLVMTGQDVLERGYIEAFSGSVRRQLTMRANRYAELFPQIVEGHRSIAEAATPEIEGPLRLDPGEGIESREWWSAGGIPGFFNRATEIQLDGEPYPTRFWEFRLNGHGAETPSFRIDGDRIDFLLAGTAHEGVRAQLVLDGRIVLSERRWPEDDPLSFERISWDVGDWRGRVARLRFLQWGDRGDFIAFDDIRSATDAERIVLDDFDGAGMLEWSSTFRAEGQGDGVQNVGMRYGARFVATGSFAHSHGLEGRRAQSSEPFALELDELRFLHWDFGDDRTGVELLVDGEVVRSIRGRDTRTVGAVRWDVADLEGRKAVLRIVDDADRGRAWIGIDSILLARR